MADVDLFAPGAQEHWYEAYPILHREAPVLALGPQGPAGAEVFVLSRYADIARVVKDFDRFPTVMSLMIADLQAVRDRGDVPPEDPSRFDLALDSIRTLRPTEALWRAHRQELTDPWVGPGAKRHRAMITRTVDELIDRWIARGDGEELGTVEFIDEFARPLPQIVMARVLGFPEEDIPRLAAWGTAQVMQFVHGRGPLNELDDEQARQQREGTAGFAEYVMDQVAEKRSKPGDDMITALTQAHYQALDRKLTDEEIVGIVYLMVLGGLETTQYALEEQAQLLCENDGLLQTLRDQPEKIRPFTEEAMRLRSPTQGLSTRVTREDEQFSNVVIPAGSILHIRFGAGNVDPAQFPCPYQLDLERKSIGNHLAFSQGTRTCPGAGISRWEQQIAWERLLDRIEHLEYADSNTFEHQPGIMLGTLALRLRFRAAQS